MRVAPTAGKPSSFQLGYRPALDGLRAISVLAVMAFHVSLPYAGGAFLGVDVFFVLSGFLISSLLIQEWESSGSINFKHFYVRRALRILPAVVTLTIVCCAVALLFQGPAERAQTLRGGLYTSIYLSNWVRAFWGTQQLGVLNHTWSLAVEEQFYFLWPLLLRGLLGARLDRRWLVLIVVAGAAASAILRIVLWNGPMSVNRLYNGLDTRADALLVGCAAGMLVTWNMIPRSLGSRLVIAVLAAASVVLLVGMGIWAVWTERYLYYGGLTAVAVAAAIVIIHLVTAPSRIALLVLEAPPLVWIGRLSYGLYLWHYPVDYLLFMNRVAGYVGTVAIAFSATFACAALSFYCIERPFLKLKERFGAAARGSAGAGTPDKEARGHTR